MTQCFSVARRSVTDSGPPTHKGHNQWSFGKTDGKPLADRRQEGGAGWLGGGRGLRRCSGSLVNVAQFPRNYLVKEISQILPVYLYFRLDKSAIKHLCVNIVYVTKLLIVSFDSFLINIIAISVVYVL